MPESETKETEDKSAEPVSEIRYPPIDHHFRGSDRFRWPDWLRRKPKSG